MAQGYNPVGLILSAVAAVVAWVALQPKPAPQAPAPGTAPATPGGVSPGVSPGPAASDPLLQIAFRNVQVFVQGRKEGQVSQQVNAVMSIGLYYEYQGPTLHSARFVYMFRELLLPPALVPDVPLAPQVGEVVWSALSEPEDISGSPAWRGHTRGTYVSVPPWAGGLCLVEVAVGSLEFRSQLIAIEAPLVNFI